MTNSKKSHRKSAFSLIEVALVILVISLILTAVIEGKELLTKSKIAKANQLTAESPLHDLPNVTFWFEAINPLSFKENESQDYLSLESDDQSLGIGSITKWYDRNPQPETRKNATAASISQAPKYYRKCLGGIPCLYFNGSQNYLTIANTNALTLNDYSIFIVEKRDSTSGSDPIIGSDSASSQDQSLEIGYSDANTIYWNQGNSAHERQYSSSELSKNKPTLHSFINATNKNGSDDLKYYLNSTLVATSNPGTSTNFTSTTLGSALQIGKSSSIYYEGNISEVIILPFSVSKNQRIAIQQYLLTKWYIK